MAISLDRANPAMPFLPPQLDWRVVNALKLILPAWLRWRCHLRQIEVQQIDRLVGAYQAFYAGKSRYLFAFRHPTTDDQFALFHLFGNCVSQSANKAGIQFERSPHIYYVYDRGIPLWAGQIVNYLFPRTGGIPTFRGKLDRQGLQTIRHYLLDGEHPLVIAPEGGTNGKSEAIAQLEPGTAQLAFWTVEDLVKAGRSESVYILPITLQYAYGEDAWPNIDRLLQALEQECGLVKPAVTAGDRYARLYGLGDFLITYVSQHYDKFYSTYPLGSDPTADLGQRVQALIDRILRVAEAHFNITPKGTTVDRCRRLEAATWDQVFRADLDLTKLSIIERGFADHLATEAASSMWHMRIAESILAITGSYVQDKPTPSRYAETLLSLWRALARVKSEAFGSNPHLGDRQLTITIGEPISVSDRYPIYQTNRNAAKEAVAQLTQAIQASFSTCFT